MHQQWINCAFILIFITLLIFIRSLYDHTVYWNHLKPSVTFVRAQPSSLIEAPTLITRFYQGLVYSLVQQEILHLYTNRVLAK